MTKILFLDNDGVICLQDNWGGRYKKQKAFFTEDNPRKSFGDNGPVEVRFDNFDEKAVKVLNEILEQTGAEIVVSSDWRLHATLEELGDYYESQGIIKRPIGVTERFSWIRWKEDGFIKDHGEFPWSRHENREQERYFEIKRWLRDHPEVTHWVAVDDLHMGVHVENSWRGAYDREDWGLENFVWTPRDWEGIKQTGIKEQILKYLKDAV
jgi:hypothetical protein